MRRLLILLATLALVLIMPAAGALSALALPTPTGPEGLSGGVLPVPGTLVTAFRPPPEPWLPGHRGVDLLAPAGTPVLAAATGTVTYAGMIAGRGVVVVTHGALRSTYEPVQASVRVGQQVGAGEAIGVLQTGHAGCVDSCLHWGLRRGEDYLDPMLLPVTGTGAVVRLVGEAEVDAARREAAARALAEVLEAAALAAGTASTDGPDPGGSSGSRGIGGAWLAPVRGPLTSPFGMRVHPVTGVYKLHDGVDYGAACGTPIRAPLAGTVTEVTYHPAYGWRARVDHGTVGGSRLVTSFNHAQGYSVRSGQQVVRGQVLGTVGSTGWSTGCHLHLMAWRDGGLVDPSRLG
ncbi:Peptidase family M23 [Raineyella antarctica]|uniref:Peptidase family M23 n=1 Tax=Raineyella antarctica TaxID=1577474 RepID=A0A1G6H9R6_9ACTN|nr:peptidoglycan DD-metalloendopeptidase family protein [Raineyella antarctica]SDB91039.1 Peptidase family M23 [Raineyella antarctica]